MMKNQWSFSEIKYNYINDLNYNANYFRYYVESTKKSGSSIILKP